MAKVLDIDKGSEGSNNEFSNIIKSRSGKFHLQVNGFFLITFHCKNKGSAICLKGQDACYVQVHAEVPLNRKNLFKKGVIRNRGTEV